jgi:hypothetical protein
VSRVYFHSPSGTAELHGSERAWLDFLSRGPAKVAYNLDRPSSFDLSKIARLLELLDPADDLHRLYRSAQAEYDSYSKAWEGKTFQNPGPPHNRAPMELLVERLRYAIVEPMMQDTELRLGDISFHASAVASNTALAVGSDPIALAAKIHGYCEIHGFIEGEHREWFANIIDEGLDVGVYRRGLDYEKREGESKWISQGWEAVQALLRKRNDEPVVMSYSVCDQFPNSYVAEWEAPEDDPDAESWYDLPADEQWNLGLAGIRKKPWLSISPDTLRGYYFGLPITVYDLLAHDRNDRIRSKCSVSPPSTHTSAGSPESTSAAES